MKDNIVILGASGFATEVLEIILDEGKHNPIGFIVDHEYAPSTTLIHGYPVLGGFDWFIENERTGGYLILGAVLAVGTPELRRRFSIRCYTLGVGLVSIIHPSASISRWATIGGGSVIAHNCIVRNNSLIGVGCFMNMGSTLGHDSSMDDYASLMMGVNVTGGVSIEEGAYIGSGVTFNGPHHIGKWSRVGCGSVVIRDVPDNSTVIGIPAKVVQVREDGWQE